MQNKNEKKTDSHSDDQTVKDWFLNDGKRKKTSECQKIVDEKFAEKWIKDEADEFMNDFTENAGKYMAPQYEKDKEKLSKSQIRNVYGEIKRIQLKGIDNSEGKSSFVLLKAKVAYAEGRNKTMGLTLFKLIFDKGWQIVVDNKFDSKMYNNFCNLLEAILAYHKAYGGKD